MSTRKSNTARLKSQPSTKQTHEQWHEERYGELRDKLSDETLKQLVEEICGKNYDSESAAALVLLMDEIERSQFDRFHVCGITQTVSTAAFKYTNEHGDAAQKMVVEMRSRSLGTEVLA